MVFFCHGVINFATFHYQGDNVDAGLFGKDEIHKIYESIFDYDAEVTTYACRAGISVECDDFTGKDAGQMHSPAQQMADAWDVEVMAFEMRSSYVGVYGTKNEIQSAQNYGDIIKKYENEVSEYKETIAQGNKEAIAPHKPDDYDENVRRYRDLKERTSNEKDGGPIAPNGSWCHPGTGNTPKGLKSGLQNYKSKEWIL